METQNPPVIEPASNSPQNQVVVAPNIDSELDAALSKSFPQNAIPNNEPVKEEADKPEVKVDPKVEQKPQGKSEDKKADKPIAAEKPLLSPDEVDKIEPKKQDAWTALKNNNKNAHKMIEARDAEIVKLKAVVAERGQMSQKELDSLKKENEELAKYRAMIDIEADPEFVSKFDQPIENTMNGIKSMLKGMNISEELINQIDFSNTKLMEEIISNVGENRDKFVARKMERMVEDLMNLKDKRDETLSEQKEKYKETLEARKKQAFEKSTEGEGRMIKHLEVIAAMKDKSGNPMFDFLNKKQPKETANQLEVDQVNAHNHLVDLMQQKVQEALKMNEPEQRAELAVAAAGAHYLSAQLRSANAKIQSLQNEVQKLSAVTTETEKSKPVSSKRNGNGDGRIMDTDEALHSFFQNR